MFTHSPVTLLKNVLYLDAATCAVMGAALTIGAGPLASLLVIPAGLLFYAGVALFPIAAFMAFAARRTPAARPAVWLVIVGNILWVAASLWLIVSGWIAPNALGYAFVGVQALAVAAMTALEHVAVRRTTTAVAV